MKSEFNLTGKYKETYKQIKSTLLDQAKMCEATDNALRDIQPMLFQASSEGQTILELFPDGLGTFCASVLESLPSYSIAEKYKLKRARNIKKYCVLTTSLLLLCALTLWYSGIFSLWKDGMWALVNKTENRSCNDIGLWRGTSQPWTVELDMNDLDSNIGKILFVDESGSPSQDGCKIIVGEVGFNETNRKRQYWIRLDCFADYDLNHTTYYFPQETPTGMDNNLVHSMIFEGEEYSPLHFYGSGSGERDYLKYFFYLPETDADYVFADPIVTLNFWSLNGYSYTRTD